MEVLLQTRFPVQYTLLSVQQISSAPPVSAFPALVWVVPAPDPVLLSQTVQHFQVFFVLVEYRMQYRIWSPPHLKYFSSDTVFPVRLQQN